MSTQKYVIQILLSVRGGFSELGAPGKYRNGALYICTNLPRSTLRFLFCRDACCCTMVPHSCVQCFYMLHVIMGFFHLHLFIHLTVTFILSCCRPRNSNCFTVEIQVLTKNKINYKMINLTIEPVNLFFFLKKRDESEVYIIILFKTGLCGWIFALV